MLGSAPERASEIEDRLLGELCEVGEAEFTASEFALAIDSLFIPAQQLEHALPGFQLRPLEPARASLTLRQSGRARKPPV